MKVFPFNEVLHLPACPRKKASRFLPHKPGHGRFNGLRAHHVHVHQRWIGSRRLSVDSRFSVKCTRRVFYVAEVAKKTKHGKCNLTSAHSKQFTQLKPTLRFPRVLSALTTHFKGKLDTKNYARWTRRMF